MRWSSNLPFGLVHCCSALRKKQKPVKTLGRVRADGMLRSTFHNVGHTALLKIIYHNLFTQLSLQRPIITLPKCIRILK